MGEIAQMIKKMGLEAGEASGQLQFIEGEVLNGLPDIEVRLRGNDKLILTSQFVMVSEHLTQHKRSIILPDEDKPKEIEFQDTLKIGDRVMVAAIQGGQTFFIIDRF